MDALHDLLPDRAYPRGVVELQAAQRLGGATSLALTAIAALHAADPHAHAAWIDSEGSLYAPGACARGVDLARLLVVRPSWESMASVALKVTQSTAFPMVVIDVDRSGFSTRASGAAEATRTRARQTPLGAQAGLFVRKLQIAAEAARATVLLLTDAHVGRSPLPVSLRLLLARRRHSVRVRVDKDRQGRVGVEGVVRLEE